MAERRRQRPRTHVGPPPVGVFPGGLPADDGTDDTVLVFHGPYMERLPVSDMTVGDIRTRFGDRLDIDPLARAVVDGNEAAEDTVVHNGQMLTFVRKAGEKGNHMANLKPGPLNSRSDVTLRGEKAFAVSPEGLRADMNITRLMEMVAGSVGTRSTGLLPQGVRVVISQGRVTIWVYERVPQVYNFSWISPDSPAPYGRNARYRNVRIALPYLVVLGVFARGDRHKMKISKSNECFFRTAPLKGMDDNLLFPALLNCSKFNPPEKRPLSWICTAKMDLKPAGHLTESARMMSEFQALLNCLLATGFNLSSEFHEESSWFTASAHVDRRISTVENWEKATVREGPLFVMDVPWLDTGMTLRQVIGRIFSNMEAHRSWISSSADVLRILFNHGYVS